MPREISLPYNWQPRAYQRAVWCHFQGPEEGKRGAVVWHRRGGKDLTGINLCARKSQERVGTYWHLLPTYKQGRAIVWNGVTREGRRFLDHFPKELVEGENATEMRVSFKNGSMYQVVGTDDVNCYDSETEVLTERGWVKFENLFPGDKVASLVSGSLQYRVPNAIITSEYSGKMVSVQSKAIDLLVTPNHRFWVKSRKGVLKFKTASELSPSNDMIPSTCNWEGEDKANFIVPLIPDAEWTCGKGRKVSKSWALKFEMKDWCSFMGIFLAEGSVFSDGKNYRVHIAQKKPAGVEWIRALLTRMGLNVSHDGNVFTIHDKQLWTYCSQFGYAKNKFIPQDLKRLSRTYLQPLLDGLIMGDGHRAENDRYFTVSKQLADDVQEIGIKLGYSCNIRRIKQSGRLPGGRFTTNSLPLYRLIFRRSKFKRLHGPSGKTYMSRDDYAGRVYCVDVGGLPIKVRRNGKESWCGNSLVGTNPVGCIFSEYSLHDPSAWEYIRPILAENGGWALFIFTPRGKNHGYRLLEHAKKNEIFSSRGRWFWQILKAGSGPEATKRPDGTPVISDEAIDEERREGMPEEMIAQEFYCSFEAPLIGAYYGDQFADIEKEKRVTNVPWEPALSVDTYWDLGVGDATSIWFVQHLGQEHRVIDYYETSGEGLPHYAKELQKKPYVYGRHYAPHDIEVREFSSGKSRIETARSLGIRFITVQRHEVEDGIEAVRNLLRSCWFDSEKCERGVECLKGYRKEWDDKRRCYKNNPYHDFTSHAADAFRMFAWSFRRPRKENMKQKRAVDNYAYLG